MKRKNDEKPHHPGPSARFSCPAQPILEDVTHQFARQETVGEFDPAGVGGGNGCMNPPPGWDNQSGKDSETQIVSKILSYLVFIS